MTFIKYQASQLNVQLQIDKRGKGVFFFVKYKISSPTLPPDDQLTKARKWQFLTQATFASLEHFATKEKKTRQPTKGKNHTNIKRFQPPIFPKQEMILIEIFLHKCCAAVFHARCNNRAHCKCSQIFREIKEAKSTRQCNGIIENIVWCFGLTQDEGKQLFWRFLIHRTLLAANPPSSDAAS